MKKIIFGAGAYGEQALEQLGEDNVMFFLDNDNNKQGKMFHGKKVITIKEFLSFKEHYHVVLASLYAKSMEKQLLENGINDYSFFLNDYRRFYETDHLVYNPYQEYNEVSSEEEWNNSSKLDFSKKAVFDAVEEEFKEQKLFNHIEIETINRCNGTCSFCPVNHKVDPRQKHIMTNEMFKDIIKQLEEVNYSGRFTTFSNNEPLLDDRLIEFNQYARNHLPNAKIHLFTNGTLLTIEKFKKLMEVIDELIIDNYQQDLKLIKPCIEIQKYCEEHPELKKKVTIVLRKPNEILTSRGGEAPNRKEIKRYPKERCILPFKQFIIRPDGKVSLCCNDAVGRYTLGDLNKESILDIWYGPKFQMVRKCLYEGRENWGDCQYCDAFSMG